MSYRSEQAELAAKNSRAARKKSREHFARANDASIPEEIGKHHRAAYSAYDSAETYHRLGRGDLAEEREKSARYHEEQVHGAHEKLYGAGHDMTLHGEGKPHGST